MTTKNLSADETAAVEKLRAEKAAQAEQSASQHRMQEMVKFLKNLKPTVMHDVDAVEILTEKFEGASQREIRHATRSYLSNAPTKEGAAN